MKLALVFVPAGALLLGSLSFFDGDPTPVELAARVIEDRGAREAVEALRAVGPQGLEAGIAARDLALLGSEDRARVDAAIDQIAGQRYASISKLYWYTDLELAMAEAARTHRPILSLRLLGDLREEMSCANSRFFRTVLYANPAVAEMLAKDFVLHWSSERTPPVMTIDFGDGRTIRRTVTGNSVHYVLDAGGRVLDALPGLHAPNDFIERLSWAKSLALESDDKMLAKKHADRSARSRATWNELRGAVASGRGRARVAAVEAMPIAISKSRVERPAVRAIDLENVPNERVIDFALTSNGPAELSGSTLALMRRENRGLDGSAFEVMVRQFRDSVARDSFQNEHVLHQRIHEKLMTAPRPDFAAFNAWVYAEIFATPAADPWLGLHDDAIYTGIEDAGISR